jgi:hypothetical protein
VDFLTGCDFLRTHFDRSIYIGSNPLRIAVSLLFKLVGARLCQLKGAERLEAAIAGFQPARAMVDAGVFPKLAPDAPKMIVHSRSCHRLCAQG